MWFAGNETCLLESSVPDVVIDEEYTCDNAEHLVKKVNFGDGILEQKTANQRVRKQLYQTNDLRIHTATKDAGDLGWNTIW